MPVITEQFTNFASSTVYGGAGGAGTFLNAADTSLLLSPGDGTKFAATTNGTSKLLLGDPLGANEIVLMTTRATDTCTITRAQEGTSAQTWAFGTPVQATVTAASWQTLYSRITGTTFYARDYGAKFDGSTDDTTAIAAAITAAGAVAGIVDLPPGTGVISSTLTLGNGSSGVTSTINGVTVRGAGLYATTLKWAGSAGGTMAQIAGVCNGNMFTDLTLDCQSSAGYGLHITSGQYANCPSLSVQNATICCLLLDTWPSSSGGQQDTLGIAFGKLILRCGLGTISVQSHGLWLTGGAAAAFDTSQCSFQNVSIWAQNNYNTALRLSNCDFNYFGIVNGFFSSVTGHFGLVLDGAVANFPQNNYIGILNSGGAFSSNGTPGTNYVGLYDTNDNAGAAPGLGTGLVGLAEPVGSEGAPYPFGTGASVTTPGEVLNFQLTTTGATNIVALTGPTAGLYLAVLAFRVVTGATLVTAQAKATDDSTSVITNYFFSCFPAATSKFAVNGGSESVGSYICDPIPLRYSGSGTVPTITVTAGTANQVFCTASIIKIG